MKSDDLGPFSKDSLDNGDMKKLVSRFYTFTIVFPIKVRLPENPLESDSNCFDWKIQQNYNFEYRNVISLRMSFEHSICHETEASFTPVYYITAGVTMFFSVISVILIVRYYIDIVNLFSKIRKEYQAMML